LKKIPIASSDFEEILANHLHLSGEHFDIRAGCSRCFAESDRARFAKFKKSQSLSGRQMGSGCAPAEGVWGSGTPPATYFAVAYAAAHYGAAAPNIGFSARCREVDCI
jgi:hypothetical protein